MLAAPLPFGRILSCASPSLWDEQYGYSESYFDFVYHLVDHWQGHFPVIVIENEANASNFWAGTADDPLGWSAIVTDRSLPQLPGSSCPRIPAVISSVSTGAAARSTSVTLAGWLPLPTTRTT